MKAEFTPPSFLKLFLKVISIITTYFTSSSWTRVVSSSALSKANWQGFKPSEHDLFLIQSNTYNLLVLRLYNSVELDIPGASMAEPVLIT